MAHTLSPTELGYLRSDGQASFLYLAIANPPTIFTARVNQSFTTNDMVYEITYDTAGGTYTDVLPGMTLLIGTSAGAYDLGMARIRKAATATKLYVGEGSEIAWANNVYLTVIDEFGLWAKHLYVDINKVVYMDRDIPYTDQHNLMDPVVVMGPDAIGAVNGDFILHPAGMVGAGFDATASWFPDGSTLASYAWSAPGSAGSIDGAPGQKIFLYDTQGTYRVACTVTSTNGKSSTGFRTVIVFDETHLPINQFKLKQPPSGDYMRGGWEFSVDMYDQASLALVRDRAKVLLFAKEYYGTTLTKVGPFEGFLTGRNAIVCAGWIAGESLTVNPDGGYATFTVKGPQAWISLMNGFPVGVENTSSTPAAWTEIYNLTTDKGLWSFIHWRSTIDTVIDVALSGDTRLSPATEAPAGKLWDQLVAIANLSILAQPCCDRYGRLFVEINGQYIPAASRSSIPVVLTLAKNDLTREYTLDRSYNARVGQVSLSGVAYDGSTGTALISLANGHIPKRVGDSEIVDHLLLTNQSEANELAGLVIAQRNNLYPTINLPLAANNRAVDICPLQRVGLDLLSADTPRQVSFSGNVWARTITLEFVEKVNFLRASIVAEAETVADISVTGDLPQNAAPGDTPLPAISFPALPPFPGFSGFSGANGQTANCICKVVANNKNYSYEEGNQPTVSWDTITNLIGNNFTLTGSNHVITVAQAGWYIFHGYMNTDYPLDSLHPLIQMKWPGLTNGIQFGCLAGPFADLYYMAAGSGLQITVVSNPVPGNNWLFTGTLAKIG
jgi:hypothetical protein